MAIKALVTGDLHLGRRSAAVPVEEERASTRYTWKRMVQYAVDQKIDLVLLTGDIVDQDNKFYEAIEPLQAGFDCLNEAGIPVYMVAGNHDHDVLAQIVAMNRTEKVYLLGQNGEWENRIFEKEGEAVRIMGWSFPDRYVDREALSAFQPEAATGSMPIWVLLHGDAYQAVSRYHPLSVAALKSHTEVQAWLLGHIHKMEVLNAADPLILYPGSPHALSAKEQGEHGFYLLTLTDGSLKQEYVPVSPVYYDTLTIEVSAVEDEATFRNLVVASLRTAAEEMQQRYNTPPDYLVYDLLFKGNSNYLLQLQQWGTEIKEYDFNRGSHIVVRTLSYEIEPVLDIIHLSNDPSYIGVLAQAIQTLEAGESSLFTDRLIARWKERFKRVSTSPAFIPLQQRMTVEELEGLARKYVLQECNLLISELNRQKNEN